MGLEKMEIQQQIFYKEQIVVLEIDKVDLQEAITLTPEYRGNHSEYIV